MQVCEGVGSKFQDPSTLIWHHCAHYLCFPDDPEQSPLDCRQKCPDYFECLLREHNRQDTSTSTTYMGGNLGGNSLTETLNGGNTSLMRKSGGLNYINVYIIILIVVLLFTVAFAIVMFIVLWKKGRTSAVAVNAESGSRIVNPEVEPLSPEQSTQETSFIEPRSGQRSTSERISGEAVASAAAASDAHRAAEESSRVPMVSDQESSFAPMVSDPMAGLMEETMSSIGPGEEAADHPSMDTPYVISPLRGPTEIQHRYPYDIRSPQQSSSHHVRTNDSNPERLKGSADIDQELHVATSYPDIMYRSGSGNTVPSWPLPIPRRSAIIYSSHIPRDDPVPTPLTGPDAGDPNMPAPWSTERLSSPIQVSDDPPSEIPVWLPAQESSDSLCAKPSEPPRWDIVNGHSHLPREAGGTQSGHVPVSVRSRQEPVSIRSRQEPVSIRSRQEPVSIRFRQEPPSIRSRQEPVSIRFRQEHSSIRSSIEFVQDPGSAQYVREPIRAQYVREPIRAQYVREPIRAQSVREPTSAQSVQEPISSQSVQEPISTQHVQEPISAQSVQEPISTQYVQEPISAQSVHEPTSTSSIHEPASAQFTREPVSTQSVQESLGIPSTQEPASVQYIQGPVHAQSMPVPVSAQSIQGHVRAWSMQEPGRHQSVEEPATMSINREAVVGRIANLVHGESLTVLPPCDDHAEYNNTRSLRAESADTYLLTPYLYQISPHPVFHSVESEPTSHSLSSLTARHVHAPDPRDSFPYAGSGDTIRETDDDR